MSRSPKSATKNKRAPGPSDVAKALSHPLRLSILSKLNRRVASPKELADELGESLPTVSYHVKILAQLGCIELAHTVPRRGALEHFYRPLRRAELSTQEWGQLPRSARESLTGVAIKEIFDSASDAILDGSFDRRTDRHLSVTFLELDEDGWATLNDALDQLYEQALELQAQALNQESATLRSALALAHFERAPAKTPSAKRRPARADSRRRPRS